MNPMTEKRTTVNATDVELAKKVRLYLTANRHGFRRIDIHADGGLIRLSGPVHSFFLRQLAIATASRVAGVRQVIDDLEVDCQGMDTR